MEQFGRKYRLEIGGKNDSLSFSDLRLAFSIQKTISAQPNMAEIQITNLNQSNRNLIATKQYNKINLYVGYGNDDARLVFTGDIIKVETIRNGVDFVTKLSCADGYIAFTQSYVVTTLSAGVTDADVVDTALSSMNIPKSKVELPNDRALPRGKVMMANTRELLNDIAINNDSDWSIQDGQLVLLPKSKAFKNDEGFIVNQTSGMIGSPNKTSRGLEVDTLLNPAFKIGQLVRIESIIEANNGDYKITDIIHTGDSHDNGWKTHLICSLGDYKA